MACRAAVGLQHNVSIQAWKETGEIWQDSCEGAEEEEEEEEEGWGGLLIWGESTFHRDYKERRTDAVMSWVSLRRRPWGLRRLWRRQMPRWAEYQR